MFSRNLVILCAFADFTLIVLILVNAFCLVRERAAYLSGRYDLDDATATRYALSEVVR